MFIFIAQHVGVAARPATSISTLLLIARLPDRHVRGCAAGVPSATSRCIPRLKS
jgi:hypothetical protein